MLEDLIKNFSGPFIVIAFFSSNFLSFIINDCLILLFYLCYYTIARYIRLLRVRMLYNSTSVEPWKGCKKVLINLSKALAALESAFSLPILYTITSKLVTVSLYLFTTINGLLRPNSLFATTSALVSIIEVFYSLIIVLCVLCAADLPVHQVGGRPRPSLYHFNID